ncbi:MAG: alpha-N-arabinofuranosidase, partial [Planctomycetia bacterium]|nr:alpha-N-arabinofuranosidase [Planctomycetia bacterium]
DYISIHHYESENYAGGPEAFRKYLETLKGIIAESENPELEIFVSEWNLQSTDWRTGLYAGGVLNVFESHGDKMT